MRDIKRSIIIKTRSTLYKVKQIISLLEPTLYFGPLTTKMSSHNPSSKRFTLKYYLNFSDKESNSIGLNPKMQDNIFGTDLYFEDA